MTKRIVAIDTETWLLEPGLMAPPVVCITTAEDSKPSQLIHRRDPECRRVLQEYLEDDNVVIVGQNFAYDAAVLIQAFPELTKLVFDKYEAGLVCDTQIREQLMDIASDRLRHGHYSLKSLVKQYFNLDLEKDEWRLRYKELDDVPVNEWPSGAKDYATLDAEYTLKVYKMQHLAADDYHDETRPYALVNETAQTAGAFALHLTAAWGIRTNKASVDSLEESTRSQLEGLKDILIKAGILIFKSKKKGEIGGYRKSTSAVWKLVEEAYADDEDGVPLTATGRTKTDRLTLTQSENELLASVALYVEKQKVLSTTVPLLRRAETRPLNTRYGMANSGRTTSSPNFQNLPRQEGAREAIEARDGFLFCSVDYDTAELRALAQFCEQTFGYSKLAEALRAGDDPHLMLAATILGITHEEAKRRKGDKDVKDARQVSKLINFGLPGGMGIDTFILNCAKQGVTLTRARVQELKHAYTEQWPEMEAFFEMASQATKTSTGMGDVYTPWSGRLRANCFYSAYLNQHFQGPVADLAKAALLAVAYECFTGYCYPGTEQTADGRSPLFGARPTLFVHDEVIAEISADPDLGDRQARRMALVMRSVAERTITDIPMTCEPALMKRWTKNSKSVLDEKGRYVSCN